MSRTNPLSVPSSVPTLQRRKQHNMRSEADTLGQATLDQFEFAVTHNLWLEGGFTPTLLH